MTLIARFGDLGGVELDLPSHLGRRPHRVMTNPVLPSGKVILDTNVVSELMWARPDGRVKEWVRRVPPAAVYTTSVTVAAMRFGIARLATGRRRAVLGEAADVFGAFAHRVLSFDADTASQYALIVVEREQARAPISGFDAQVADICRSYGAALVIRNTDDFSQIGLTLIDPWIGDHHAPVGFRRPIP